MPEVAVAMVFGRSTPIGCDSHVAKSPHVSSERRKLNCGYVHDLYRLCWTCTICVMVFFYSVFKLKNKKAEDEKTGTRNKLKPKV